MDEPNLVQRSARGRGVLAATVLGSGMAQLDSTVVNVALPRIGADLHAQFTSLQWTVNAYTLTLSGLLLLGGSLGDRLGRRRIFMLGTVWFAIASAACAASPSSEVLIAMRALQGVGAALLTPGSLAIIEAVFRKDDRGSAVGAWSGLGGVASAIGPVLGGVLVGIAGWGWRLVFLINLPLAAVALVLSARFIPETRDDETAGRLDIGGAVLAAGGLALVVYGLTEGPDDHWRLIDIICLVAGAAVLAGFLVFEARIRHPMMPLKLFGEREFSAANLVTFGVYAAFGSALFLLPVQLQQGSGYSPLAAGSALLPITAVMLVLSPRMGSLGQRIGPRWPMTIGPILAGVGLALLARVGPQASYAVDVLPAILVFALGLSTTVAPLTATALAAAPEREAGVASAINNNIARVGTLLAVAILPGIAGITSSVYGDPDRLSTGFHHAVFIAAGVAVLSGLVAAAMVRGGEGPAEQDDESDERGQQPEPAADRGSTLGQAAESS